MNNLHPPTPPATGPPPDSPGPAGQADERISVREPGAERGCPSPQLFGFVAGQPNPPPRGDAPTPFHGRLFLSSLSQYGNLPFRRLCVEFGADGTLSEMILAHRLVAHEGRDTALLRHHPSEPFFGVQLVGRDPEVLAAAAIMAEGAGAHFIDLNMACPIRAVVHRGAGAGLLQRPKRILEIVSAVRKAVTLPVTVKLRAGWNKDQPNIDETGAAAVEGGASAIFLHPRSREQHYRRAADWTLVAQAVARFRVPVIGGGDLFHPEDVTTALQTTGCASVFFGRGALHKPWIFREVREGRNLDPSAEQRLEWLRVYVRFALEHFGEDELGRKRARWFLSQLLSFLSRYVPCGAVDYRQAMQARSPGFTPRSELEALLARDDPESHQALCSLAGLRPEQP